MSTSAQRDPSQKGWGSSHNQSRGQGRGGGRGGGGRGGNRNHSHHRQRRRRQRGRDSSGGYETVNLSNSNPPWVGPISSLQSSNGGGRDGHERCGSPVSSASSSTCTRTSRSATSGGRRKVSGGKHHSISAHTLESCQKVIDDLTDVLEKLNLNISSQDSDVDDLIQRMVAELKVLTSELHSNLTSKYAGKDRNINKAMDLLYQGMKVLEEYLTSLTSCEKFMCNRIMGICTLMWDEIAFILCASLQDRNEVKYSPRKASTIKLQNTEVEKYFSIQMMSISMATTLDIDWDLSSGSSSSVFTSSSGLFQEEFRCNRMKVGFRCLRDFISAFGFQLHPEREISRFVDSIILALISFEVIGEEDVDDTSKKYIGNILAIQSAALECIVRILRWKQHASALLAPLVIDVDVGGEEQLTANPLREKLLQSVMNLLENEVYLWQENSRWLCYACDCLTSLFDNIRVIDGTKNSSSQASGGKNGAPNTQISYDSDQVRIAKIFKWVHKTLQSQTDVRLQNGKSLRWHSLSLLRAVIKLHPRSCSQYWALFLPQLSDAQYSKVPNSESFLQTPRNINLITIISSTSANGAPSAVLSEEKIMATACSGEILNALPLRLWSRTGYLLGRIESSLETTITSTTFQLAQQNHLLDELEASYSLAKIIITVIPYMKYRRLVKPAVGLMGQIGRNYATFGLHGGFGLETNLKTLTECLGGIETPSGSITPLPIPTHEWLVRSTLSATFINHMLSKMAEISSHEVIQKGILTTLQMNLFVRVVQCATWILFKNESGMVAFVELTNKLMQADDSALKVTGTRLVKALVEGREEVALSQEGATLLSSSTYRHLSGLLSENESQVRSSTLATYGSLHFLDWKNLLLSENNPIPVILPMSMEYSGDTDARVRSEACRAIGNIITTCMTESSSLSIDVKLRNALSEVVEETIQVTAAAIEDSESNVRSMALFAMGNIALALGSSECAVYLKRLPLIRLCESVYERLLDENEKVVNNAIRTAGHLFHLPSNQEGIQRRDLQIWLNLCDKFSLELGRKINLAIMDTDSTLESRSWRQRSSAKKHAWGACQALLPIFQFFAIITNGDSGGEGIRTALVHLIQCLEHMDRMNAKILMGAATTLAAVPVDIWYSVSVQVGQSIPGICLATCLTKIGLPGTQSGIRHKIDRILEILLACIDDNGILTCLDHADLSQEMIQYLYTWMVDHDVGAQVYESFGRILPLSHLRSDVSMIQRFQSRAIFEARKARRSFNQSEQDDHLMLLDEDSDEDEL